MRILESAKNGKLTDTEVSKLARRPLAKASAYIAKESALKDVNKDLLRTKKDSLPCMLFGDGFLG